jgi:hypothetical protein
MLIMDGQQSVEQPTSTDVPDKQPRHSFMDIRGPKTETNAAVDPKPVIKTETPQTSTTSAPASVPKENLPADMPDLALAPPEEKGNNSDNPSQSLEESKKDKHQKAAKVTKPPKPPRQPGVGFAIFATIVIILGLGALATYAYLRTNNITLL